VPESAWIARLERTLGDHFRDPWLLCALVLVPIVFWLAARAPAALTYSSLAIPDAGPGSLRVRLAKLPALLLCVAAACLAIAMAGPRTGDAATLQRREGIAILMVVDHSGSMTALDFAAKGGNLSRLDAVKQVFRDFVTGGERTRGRADDLIGLIAFATYADGLCPLTFDRAVLLSSLSDLEPAPPDESGTAIGDALALAVERLRQNPSRSKVVVLLTDGVSNAGEILPTQAADLAAQYGVKVYSIGAGRNGYAPVPVQTRDGGVQLERRYMEFDDATLQVIAERTGGRYFHATDVDSLTSVVQEIDRLERTELAESRYLQHRYHHEPLVGAAVGLVLLATLASGTWLRRLP